MTGLSSLSVSAYHHLVYPFIYNVSLANNVSTRIKNLLQNVQILHTPVLEVRLSFATASIGDSPRCCMLSHQTGAGGVYQCLGGGEASQVEGGGEAPQVEGGGEASQVEGGGEAPQVEGGGEASQVEGGGEASQVEGGGETPQTAGGGEAFQAGGGGASQVGGGGEVTQVGGGEASQTWHNKVITF